MDVSAVAAASISFSSAKVMQQANLTMMKKTMELQESQVASLISSVQSTPVAPSFGHSLNARA